MLRQHSTDVFTLKQALHTIKPEAVTYLAQ